MLLQGRSFNKCSGEVECRSATAVLSGGGGRALLTYKSSDPASRSAKRGPSSSSRSQGYARPGPSSSPWFMTHKQRNETRITARRTHGVPWAVIALFDSATGTHPHAFQERQKTAWAGPPERQQHKPRRRRCRSKCRTGCKLQCHGGAGSVYKGVIKGVRCAAQGSHQLHCGSRSAGQTAQVLKV